MCVIRIAESVVFTCCPPAPLARYVSIFKSSCFTSISTSSDNSGETSQDTKDVCRRPEESNGEIRTRDRKSTRLNSSHVSISYAVFCLKKKSRAPHSSYQA